MAVTAVVVHYRGGEHLDRCLEACLGIDAVREVIVLDNEGVGDALRARHPDPRVRVVEAPRNLGFGRAANVGIALARTDAVLVLNQDVVVAGDALEAMLEAGAASGAWIVAPRLRDASGVERSRKVGVPPPLAWNPPPDAVGRWRQAPYVAGAVMLLMPGHTDLRFDERFFMYGEDEDLCYRVWAAGGRVVVVEEAWALHVGATSTATRWSPRMTEYRVLLARGRFVRKHSGWPGALSWASRQVARAIRATVAQAR